MLCQHARYPANRLPVRIVGVGDKGLAAGDNVATDIRKSFQPCCHDFFLRETVGFGLLHHADASPPGELADSQWGRNQITYFAVSHFRSSAQFIGTPRRLL